MKRFFGNLIDILCLSGCGIFACIVTKTIPNPEQICLPISLLIAAAVVLILLLVSHRLTKLVWNVIYCLTSMVLIGALLHWATKGLFFPPVLQEMAAPYSIPVLLEGACYYELGSFALLWLMGALCCHAFWRVTITALGSYVVWLILALSLHIIANAWLGMPEPPVKEMQSLVREFPWLTAAFPACFVSLYAVLMSMYDALFMDWPSKKQEEKKEEAPAKSENPAAAATDAKAPATAKTSLTKPIAIPKSTTKPLATKVSATKPIGAKLSVTKPIAAPKLSVTKPIATAPAKETPAADNTATPAS